MPRSPRLSAQAIARPAGALALCAIALAGCSGESSSQTTGTGASTAASQTASAAPESAAAVPSTPSEPAADSYLTSNCAQPASPIATPEPPAGGQTLGAVTVTYDAQGAPQVTVGPQAAPVSELESLDLAPGNGPEVKPSDVITFNYCGVGMSTRQIFDSSWARNEPLTYSLDQLIPGWGVGLPGMKVGGQRLLVIPGDLGYGPAPDPSSGILPDETLIFVVEVLAVGEAS